MGPSDSALTREKRQNKRFKVRHEGMFGRLGEDHLVDIIDLSVGGIATKSGRRLAVGREYFIRMLARRHSLEVRGTVLWSRIVDSKETLFGQRVPVYISAMRIQVRIGRPGSLILSVMSCWYEAEGYSCAETDANNVNKKKACPIGQAFLHVIITSPGRQEGKLIVARS